MSMTNLIDARGPRFGAAITTVILAAVVLTHSGWLLLAQTLLFATGALLGPQKSPYGLLFRKFVKPRLAPPSKFEDVKPPQFAQAVGLLFGVIGLLGAVVEVPAILMAAASAALVAAFLNAVFDYCLGCQMYLLIKRALQGSARSHAVAAK